MFVYLDLLVLINFFFNMVLLTIAGWLGLQHFRFGRYALAALAGTISWLIFFFYPQYIFINWICRITGGLAMAFIAWHPIGLRKLLAKTLLLLVAGQLMGGGIFALAFALSSSHLGTSSQAVLALPLVAAGAMLMLAVAAWWAGRIHSAKQLGAYYGEVTVCVGDKTLTVPALLDSGNTLRHPVNSWPVVILERKAARDLFAQDLLAWLDEPWTPPPQGLESRIGLIPYKTVGGSGLLAVVRPEQLVLKSKLGSKTLSQVYIAVRPKNQPPLEHQALAFPADDWKDGDVG